MRIVSKFRDYYDSVQAMGQDRTMVYVRQVVEQKFGAWPFPHLDAYYTDPWEVCEFVVGFCGNIHPVVVVRHKSNMSREAKCIDLADVDEWVAGLKEKEQDDYHQKHDRHWHGVRRTTFARYFASCEEQKGRFAAMFEEQKSPIFVAKYPPYRGYDSYLQQLLNIYRKDKDRCIYWNAMLKNLGFARVKDPYTAFQEISQFLGNLAWPNKPIPHVSDDDLAAAKGFDEWSFRKPPTKRK